ncbi:MAG: M14 family zinc carboxypeptidase [Bacteroidales bacterium]
MKNILFTGLFFLVLLSAKTQDYSELFEKNGEIYFKIDIPSDKGMAELTKIISIDNRQGNVLWAYANEQEFSKFLELGYKYEALPHPNEGFDPEMATVEQIQNSDALNYYPTYDAYIAMMQQFEANYPTLCDLDTIGFSVNGRALLVLKISDNVHTDEAEPEFFYTSSMHGDELTGFPLMLNLIDSLLSQYGLNTRITNLVNNIEIYINPLANPDGTYKAGNNTVSGAVRYNANNVDLNRNFRDVINGLNPNTQPETFHFMAFAESRHFVMAANFHGGTEVINYPWDHKYALSADDAWWQFVSHEYADTCQAHSPSNYMNGFDDGITNGADWYVIDGGRQDYMNYFHQCREVTMEISDVKLISASLLQAHWEYNRRSLLNYLEQCLYGVRGVVTDAVSGQPMEAEVYVLSHEIDNDSSWVYSDPVTGNYHRLLYAGTYDIRFSAPCYEDRVFYGVSVANYNTTTLNVQMNLAGNSTDFSANKTNLSISESVNFNDISCANAISWQWTFEGGSPSTSVLENPVNIQYNTAGSFQVKLVIYNGVNYDSITKQNFITVSEEYFMTDGTFTNCSGLFYDSGGPDNAYSNYEDHVLTFYPDNPNGSITAEFTLFDIEYQSSCNYDWLQIFDGPTTSAPLIGEFCGTNSPGTVYSTHTTGSLTFVFHSDYSVTGPGWSAMISCEIDQFGLDLKVFPEGPYNGTGLNSGMQYVPLFQPFNVAPWNYPGTESVVAVPANVVDWVLLELHDAFSASAVNSGTKIGEKAAFLMTDGFVKELDGVTIPVFDYSVSNQLFVVLRHRNHLDILSAIQPLNIAGDYVYDFTTGSDKVYGGTDGCKEISPGIWGMIGGDANADGTIDGFDKSDRWENETGLPGLFIIRFKFGRRIEQFG